MRPFQDTKNLSSRMGGLCFARSLLSRFHTSNFFRENRRAHIKCYRDIFHGFLQVKYGTAFKITTLGHVVGLVKRAPGLSLGPRLSP